MPKFEDSYILLSEQYTPSMKKKFPFESLFASDPVKIFSPTNEDIYLAKAGIDSLKPFLDSSIDLEKNYDLMGVAFNAFVVNRANKNDQVISTEVALSSVENFKFKPMNIEHKRKEVVGMITGYGFSEFGTDKPLTLEEVKDKKDPFNVVLSGFVWRVVDPEFSDKLEASSDPSSLAYLSISTSWEMGFKDFSIAKGGKNLIEAEVITEQEKIEELKSKLLHFGGAGEDEDGSKVYLNLIGEVLPLGIGFTMRPAADVSGVKVAGSADLDSKENVIKKEEQQSLSSQTEENNVKPVIYLNSLEKSDEIAASLGKKEKSNKKEKDMLIKSINDLTDDSLKKIAATDVRELFEEEIKKASEKFSLEKKEKEDALAEIEKDKSNLTSQVETLEEANKKLQSELDEIKNIVAEKQKEELFQNRMTSLDEEFNLDDEDRQVIGEQILNLDEESFTKWYKAFSVFAKAKNKKSESVSNQSASSEAAGSDKNQKTEEENKKIEDEAAAALLDASVKKEDETLPNGGDSAGEKTLREKFAQAFNNKNVKIDLAKY
jgi:hypothetical protein